MIKNRLIALRLPEVEYQAILRLAKREKMSVSAFVRLAVSRTDEKVEFTRSIEYHRGAIRALRQVASGMKRRRVKLPAKARSAGKRT